ncbi:hypothetical protein ACWCQ0_33960 [Streptomyces massasporeus]|uniref:Uncharacterized protein n=1 Tax=Streptomyces massasporeus TaxID=67324 RepID=A0ABW6LK97_9ACTN
MPRTSGQGGQVDGGTAARIAAGLRSGAMARLLSRPSTLNIVEGSVRPAAQAFLTALPLLMTVAAFAPGWTAGGACCRERCRPAWARFC